MRALLLLLAASFTLPAQSFTDRLWRESAPVYAKTLNHPFLRGLADGSLPKERFRFYLVQDTLYLRAFSRALNALAARAPRPDWSQTLARHSVEAIQAEQQLHASLAGPLGEEEMAPVNAAYTNHLLATVEHASFAEGLAALLPCYWIYQEVGQELKRRGSRDSDYQRWIDQYSGEGYAKTVREVLQIMNAAAVQASETQRASAIRLFVRSARYEWMFWDMAWRMERWPPE